MHLRSDSIRVRILLIVGFALLPALGLALYNGWEGKREAADHAKHSAFNLVRAASAEHRRLLEASRQLLLMLSKLPEVQKRDTGSCSGLLAEILNAYPLYANLGVADATGKVFCSAVPLSRPVNISDRRYFQTARETKSFAVGDYQIGRITHRPSLNAGYPVVDSKGRVSAVAFAAIELGWLTSFLSQAHLPQGANLTVIDREETVLARFPDAEQWIGKSVAGQPIARHVLTEHEGRAEGIGLDGVERLYAFSVLHGLPDQPGLVLWASIPSSVAFREANQALLRNGAIVLVIAVLIIVTACMMSNLCILRPLKTLMERTEKIARGDFNLPAEIRAASGEFGQLAARFDEMAQSLRRRYHELQTLRAIDLGILSELELRPTLNVLLERIDQHLPYAAVTIRLHDKKTSRLEPVAWRNIERPLTAQQDGFQSLPHLVSQKRDIVVISEIAAAATDDRETLLRQGYASYLGVPLEAKGELIGVLSFYTKEKREFSAREIEFLKTVGGQASIAIDNSLLYERTKRQTSELAISNRIKDEFLSVVSHELRTPINIISGYTRLIQERVLGEINAEQSKALETVVRQTGELLAVVDSVLEASKLKAGAVSVSYEVFTVRDFLEQLREQLYDSPLAKDVKLEWDCSSAGAATLRSDRTKLRHVLKNLIDNAIKFTEQGTVRIAAIAEPTNNAIRFTVADTGIGIPDDIKSGIFEIFQQGDSSGIREYGGVGLGLYLVKQFTEILGGTVELETEIGRGTTFSIVLLAAPPDRPNIETRRCSPGQFSTTANGGNASRIGARY